MVTQIQRRFRLLSWGDAAAPLWCSAGVSKSNAAAQVLTWAYLQLLLHCIVICTEGD